MNFKASSIPLAGLISAEGLSFLGNQVAAVAIPLLVLQYTHSAFITGLAGMANILPILMAAFIGGRAIDKFGAWPMSLLSDGLSFLSVLALPLAFMYFRNVSPALIFGLVLLGALFDPTGSASRQTLVPGLARLAGRSMESVNSLRGGIESSADLLGPLLGAGLVGLIGALNTFFVNAASFLLCALLFALTVPRRRRLPSGAPREDILSGARFILGNASLRALALSGMAANFVLLPFLGLMLPVLAGREYGSPILLGICLSVFGAGATAGAFSFSRLNKLFPRSLIFYGGLSLSGASILLAGVFTSQTILVFLCACGGLLLGAGNPLEQTLLQEETPPRLRGQVFTALSAIRFAAGPFGLLLAGSVTELSGVRPVLLLGGGFLLIAAVSAWHFLPLKAKASQI